MKKQKTIAKNIKTGSLYIRCDKVSGGLYRVSTGKGKNTSWLVGRRNIKLV